MINTDVSSGFRNSKRYKMPFYKCFPCLKFQSEEFISKIDLSNIVLTDIFPDVWQHERTLEELILTSTRINALPPQLFYCQSLRKIAVNNNGLESIPNAVGSLRQLQHLNLSRNLISNIPDSIKTCKHLTHLDLSCNNLQRLPDAITCLISLQELLLNETYLEFLPANFGRLVNLQILELRLNSLITLPKSMARLSNLQRIDIGGNEFTELPEVIGELKNLRELWIDFNQIRRISANIANLRELQHFEANGNLIDPLPNEICHWRNIEVLSVCTNSLETLPFSIGMMKSLVTFKCESNQLRQLPDSICNLENLEELVISHNQLLRLPTTIGMLKKLRFIFVDGNELRTLPEELCNCSNLSVLSASRNKLTELPQNIGHLAKLKVLNIVDNYVSTLPVSVLSLINLTSLWISDNQSQPLVPLQYLDANTKTQLTCFMLPQAGLGMQQQQQIPQQNYKNSLGFQEIATVDANNINPQQIYDQREQAFGDDYETSAVCASPSRRICFAEEATIMTSTPQSVPKTASSTSAAVKCQGMEDPLATRLMRSPTPYPKELRLMSKYVRNSQKLTQKSPELQNVKEARVMSNSCSEMTASKLEKTLPNISTTLNETHFTNNSIDSAAAVAYENHVSMVNNLFNEYDQHQMQSTIPPHIDHNNLYVSQQEALQQYYATNCAVTLTNSTYDMPTYYMENLQPQLRQQNYNIDCEFQQHVLNLKEPPPYHIARVFTKKSPEDLTNYETLRNQQNLTIYDDSCQTEPFPYQQQQPQQELDSDEIVEISNKSFSSQPLTNEKTSVDGREDSPEDLNSFSSSCYLRHFNNDNNAFQDSSFDYQNNIENRLLQNTNPAVIQNAPQSDKSNEQIVNLATGDIDQTATDTNLRHDTLLQNSNGNRHVSQSMNKRTPWLFGMHKNPTVKQVTLRWEKNIGFEIEQVHNQEGIFIASTTPNTNAAHLLCHHDKLLEIDGFDFTKISISEARTIISHANPTVNIMLSRK